MDHERLKLRRPLLHRGHDRRHLHKVRARTDDVYYFEHD
jgi:hypothetical protein